MTVTCPDCTHGCAALAVQGQGEQRGDQRDSRTDPVEAVRATFCPLHVRAEQEATAACDLLFDVGGDTEPAFCADRIRRALAALPPAPNADPALPPLHDVPPTGEFRTFATWVNKAKSWIGGLHAVCFDAKGRHCAWGAHFMRARDEGTFPVRYWVPNDVRREHASALCACTFVTGHEPHDASCPKSEPATSAPLNASTMKPGQRCTRSIHGAGTPHWDNGDVTWETALDADRRCPYVEPLPATGAPTCETCGGTKRVPRPITMDTKPCPSCTRGMR